MKFSATPTSENKTKTTATRSVEKQGGAKSTFQFADNRAASIAQRKLQVIANKSPKVQQLAAVYQMVSQNENQFPIQLVARTKPWYSQKDAYQGNKVGKKRIAGDAEWLAMRRYTQNVSKAFIKTNPMVQEVLDRAEKTKKVPFNEWKGKQKDGTSQEAQHLVSSTYATTVLKWPYKWINNPRNGKMLLAGRGGKGIKTTPEYDQSKVKRHPGDLSKQSPSRGIRHIAPGRLAHPKYSEESKKYIEQYYKAHGLTIGQPIPKQHAYNIMDYLRNWHKQFDRTGTTDAIDDHAASINTPPASTISSSSPPVPPAPVPPAPVPPAPVQVPPNNGAQPPKKKRRLG